MSPTVFKAGATVIVLGDTIAFMAHLVAVAFVVGTAVLLPDRDGLPDLDPVGGAHLDLVLDLFAGHVVGALSVACRHLLSLLL
jgi:hypothetical protein